MKNKFLLLVLLLFTACAHNDYVPLDVNNLPDKPSLESLNDCRHEVLHKYYDSQPFMNGEQAIGLVASGAIAGPIGGAAFGAVMSSKDDGTMKHSDIKPAVVECMRNKGFIGTSD